MGNPQQPTHQTQSQQPQSTSTTPPPAPPTLLVSRLRCPPTDPKHPNHPLRSELSGESFTPPARAHASDAGIDLSSSIFVTVGPFLSARISHNLTIALPKGVFGQILPRSSTLQNKGLLVMTGVIDPGFRGEVQTVVFNPTARSVQVQTGERLSQLVLLPLLALPVEIVKELPSAEPDGRGVSGFGSTGGFRDPAANTSAKP